MPSEYGEFPGVTVQANEDDLTPTITHTWLHLDAIDSFDPDSGDTPHIYIFAHEREGRLDELQERADELKQQFVLAHMIVWPDELDGVVQDCDDEVLADLEWLYAVAPWMDCDGDDLAEAARRMQSEVDDR